MQPAHFLIPSGLKIGYSGTVIAETKEDITLPPGGLSLLVGLNGAGKTTLMKTLCGLIPPVCGKLPLSGVAYLPEELDFPLELTPDQIRRSVAKGAAAAELGSGLAQRLGIVLDKPYGHLSKGNRQKVRVWLTELLARTHQRSVLCLDEPMTGLDFVAREQMSAEWSADRSVHRLISLHPAEMPSDTNQILVVANGAISIKPGNTPWTALKEDLLSK